VISAGNALVLFDFHGSGLSSGSYVSFGWYETFDIDAVIRFLVKSEKVSRVCLWGRSMGASSALYYCSESFRALMGENVYGSATE
jgi:fermentation-respiration switch protein FrsA (DUF1100 family)